MYSCGKGDLLQRVTDQGPEIAKGEREQRAEESQGLGSPETGVDSTKCTTTNQENIKYSKAVVTLGARTEACDSCMRYMHVRCSSRSTKQKRCDNWTIILCLVKDDCRTVTRALFGLSLVAEHMRVMHS
jgi:hypothetical protein